MNKKFKLNTYDGIRKTITEWLEQGQLVKLSPLISNEKRQETIKKVIEIKHRIDGIDSKRESGYNTTTWENNIIQVFKKTFKESDIKSGIYGDLFTRGSDGNIYGMVSLNNTGLNRLLDANLKKYLKAKTTVSNPATGDDAHISSGGKSSKSGKPPAPLTTSLTDYINNMDNINKEITEHDIITRGFLNYYGTYQDWEERFLAAAGLYWAIDGIGSGNAELFNLLLALKATGKDLLIKLNDYLSANGINYELYTGDMGLARILDKLNAKQNKDADDIDAIEIIENIRKYI